MNERTLSCSFLLLILPSGYDIECDTFPHLLRKEVRAISAAPLGRLKLESYFMMFPTMGGIEL